MKLQFSGRVFEKYSKIKFSENPSSRSRAVPCGWTDSRTNTTKPTVAFRNFANASKKCYNYEDTVLLIQCLLISWRLLICPAERLLQ